MALDYHLDYRVAYSADSEFKGLYNWSIQEFDGDKKIGRDLIPWGWTLQFTATEFLHRQIYSSKYYLEPGEEEPPYLKHQESIRATLRPGDHDDAPPSVTRYSMVGTNRMIEDMALWIEPQWEDETVETYHARGGLSYTTDVDFRDITPEDYLYFYLRVSQKRFDEIAARVRRGDFDSAVIRVIAAHGFYSDWTPGISTDDVKVLTSLADHKVEVPEGEFHIPVLGEIGEFDLTFISKRKMITPIVKPDELDNGDIAGTFDIFDPEDYQRAQTDRLLGQVTSLNATLKNVQIAVWIVAAVALVAWLS